MPKKIIEVTYRTELQPGDVVVMTPDTVGETIRVEREVPPTPPFIPDLDVWRKREASDTALGRHYIDVYDPTTMRWAGYLRKDEDQ